MNSASRSFESNGPDVKIRGTAAHIAEKYVQLARDAQSSGDIVMAENYFQHAEHYYRVLAASQPAFQQHPGFVRADQDDLDDDLADENEDGAAEAPQSYGANGRDNRDQRDQRGDRDDRRPPRDPRDQPQPREHHYAPDEPRYGGSGNGGEQPSVNGLPSFITGGGSNPAEAGEMAGEGSENGGRYSRPRRRRYPRTVRSAEGEGGSDERSGGTETQHSEAEPAPGE
jgi:hypothetical protein